MILRRQSGAAGQQDEAFDTGAGDLRDDDDHGVLAIAQPAHAHLSGQIATRWRGIHDGSSEHVSEEMILAAAQHDQGWEAWECEPTWNATTGLPFGFTEMSTAEHLAIWSHAGQMVATQSIYAGLLVSRHGTWLQETQPSLTTQSAQDGAEQPQRTLVQEYIDAQKMWQAEMIGRLRASDSARYQAAVESATLDRHQRLISCWDWMSLVLCLGDGKLLSGERGFARVFVDKARPDERIVLTQRSAAEARVGPPNPMHCWNVHPWPFAEDLDMVKVRTTALALDGRGYPSQKEMRQALGRAKIIEMEFSLCRRQ